VFVGHLGAGLAARRAAPGVGLGTLFVAAMALDAVLWVLVLLGIEAVHVPPDFGRVHYLTFTFPYSHGLAASAGWALLAAGLARAAGLPRAPALVVGATVLSHALLDALVHVAGLPVLGPGSSRLGLGLWRHPGPELALEAGLAGLGWALYLGAPGAARGGARWALGGLVALCAGLTAAGGLAPAPPPGAGPMAVTSLATIGIVSLLAGWLERRGAGR
jgi:hypothetical protein